MWVSPDVVINKLIEIASTTNVSGWFVLYLSKDLIALKHLHARQNELTRYLSSCEVQ